MVKKQIQPENSKCPYYVEKKISTKNAEQICDTTKVNIITSSEQLAADINLYYEGYLVSRKKLSKSMHTVDSQSVLNDVSCNLLKLSP